MKKEINYVDAARFEEIIRNANLPYTAQAGFVKVHGPKGRQVYVAKTKNVGRVDISGFEMEGQGYIPFPDHGGSVKQQLDFSLPEAQVLANFEKLLKHMATLPPVEKKGRAATRATPRPKATGWSGQVESSSPVPKESRKETLQRISKQMGVPLSKKTQAELDQVPGDGK